MGISSPGLGGEETDIGPALACSGRVDYGGRQQSVGADGGAQLHPCVIGGADGSNRLRDMQNGLQVNGQRTGLGDAEVLAVHVLGVQGVHDCDQDPAAVQKIGLVQQLSFLRGR